MGNLKEILEKAKSASGAKDYQTACEIWKSLAEQGNAEAQINLGLLLKETEDTETENTEAQNNLDLFLKKKNFWKRVKGIFGQSN